MACYGCGSTDGSEVRLCPRCVIERKAHRDGFVQDQRKTLGVGEYGRPVCPGALWAILWARALILAASIVAIAGIFLALRFGSADLRQEITAALPLGGLLEGLAPETQLSITCFLSLPGCLLEAVALLLLWRMRRLGAYLSVAGIVLNEVIGVAVGSPRFYAGLISHLLSLLPFIWFSSLLPLRREIPIVPPRNDRAARYRGAVREGRM